MQKHTYIDLSTASSLLAKASDDIDLVTKLLPDERQHDNCGYHLAQSVEKILKFFCEVSVMSYAKDGKNGHSLKLLFKILMDAGEPKNIIDFLDLSDLDVYDAGSRYDHVFPEDRLELKKYLGETRELFRDALLKYQKIKKMQG